jgi:capsule polysaccharide export protein KpsE/RkpR
MNQARERLSVANKEKSELSAANTALQAQLQAITSERDALQATSGSASANLASQLEGLKATNAALEKALQEERQKLAAQGTSDQGAELVR